jgi:hypothetical protein
MKLAGAEAFKESSAAGERRAEKAPEIAFKELLPLWERRIRDVVQRGGRRGGDAGLGICTHGLLKGQRGTSRAANHLKLFEANLATNKENGSRDSRPCVIVAVITWL